MNQETKRSKPRALKTNVERSKRKPEQKALNTLKPTPGFSLVELLVVVAILAILAAVAIPLFLNQRSKAIQGKLDSNVRNGGSNLLSLTVGYPPNNPEVVSWDPSADQFVIGSGETVENTINDDTQFAIDGDTSGWCLQAINNNEQTSSFSNTNGMGGCLPPAPILNTISWNEQPVGPIPPDGGNWITPTQQPNTSFLLRNPSNGVRSFVNTPGPYGYNVKALKGVSLVPEGSYGATGWSTTNQIEIDKTKMYRTSGWFKVSENSDGPNNGTIYFGTRGRPDGLLKRSDATIAPDGNSYHYARAHTVHPKETWVLVVAHVWPDGSGSGSGHVDSGSYFKNPDGTWTKQDWVEDWVWTPNSTEAFNSFFSFYMYNPDITTHFYGLRFEEVNGTEPTLEELKTDIMQ